MGPKPHKGNRKHGKYSMRKIVRPKISKTKYEQQILRAYCNEPLEISLATLCAKFPDFKGQCMRSVGKSIEDENAAAHIKRIEKEIQRSDIELKELEVWFKVLQMRRNKFKGLGGMGHQNYLLSMKETNDCRETVTDLRKLIKCKKMLVRRIKPLAARFEKMHTKMEKINHTHR